MRSRLPVIGISLLLALLTLIPYAAASDAAGDMRFTGFLFNPYDAASYLAKMRQGYDGQFLYTLAFTENPGSGAPLFLYYLFLGHAARILQLPLLAVWHAARILGAAAFLVILWEFLGRLGFSNRTRVLAWTLTVLGSGLGFLAVLFGTFTADLWVAEYIPFLGILTSAHFPLATGLLLGMAMQIALPPRRPAPLSMAVVFLCATLLGVIQPFAILPLGAALAAWMIWMRVSRGTFPQGSVAGMLAAGLGFLPWAACYLWVTSTMPHFASWFAQNQTPTPPLWDLLLSLGIPGITVLASFVAWLRRKAPWREKLRTVEGGTLLIAIWLGISLLLLYAPIPLQRRLMLGMWIPLAALAAPKLEAWLFRPELSIRRALAAGIPLVLTNTVFLAVLLAAGLTRNPLLFLTRDEAAAVDWLNGHAQGSVVLASPRVGMWLPGMAGVRVVYGHPMETPDAGRALADVEEFFNSTDADTQMRILADRHVEWILCSTDPGICTASGDDSIMEVFFSGNVKVFSIR